MMIYAGLDVSDKTTHICVVDSDGAVLRRDVVASDPDVRAKWFERHCNGLEQVVLETGPLSNFLYHHGLKECEVPVDCIREFADRNHITTACSLARWKALVLPPPSKQWTVKVKISGMYKGEFGQSKASLQ